VKLTCAPLTLAPQGAQREKRFTPLLLDVNAAQYPGGLRGHPISHCHQKALHTTRNYPARGGSLFQCGALEGSCTQCPSGPDYHRGTWPYIGFQYGAESEDPSVPRILFVAMDRGAGFDLEEEPTFADTQRNFRNGCETRHNPHMGGVSQIMAFLTSPNTPASQYAQLFALTNAVKCVRKTGRQTSTATSEMKRHCAAHLGFEIDVLEPQIVVTQGEPPSWLSFNVLAS